MKLNRKGDGRGSYLLNATPEQKRQISIKAHESRYSFISDEMLEWRRKARLKNSQIIKKYV